MASTADPQEVVRVTADCGLDWTGRREVWAAWISDRHAHAHNKGRDGLPASCTGLTLLPRHYRRWPPNTRAEPSPDARRGAEMERQPVQPAADQHEHDWAGRGFTRPGPAAEVPGDLYRAALEDALAYTADQDGCGECDHARLCETPASRAARAKQYQRALEQEREVGS